MKYYTFLLAIIATVWINKSLSQVMVQNQGASMHVATSTNLWIKGGFKNDSLNAINGAVTNNGSIFLSKNWVNSTSSPVFLNRGGTVVLNGNAGYQTINGENNFYDLLVSNPDSVICNGHAMIYNMLQINSGKFILPTTDSIIIISDSINTAKIAAIPFGASITGSVTMQRYINLSSNNWVGLTSPIRNKTLLDWNDDIATTGFVGSGNPSNSFNNIYTYNESITGNMNEGWIGASNITDSIGVGVGFLSYLQAGPTNLDVTGVVNQGNYNFGVSYSSDFIAPQSENGWNFIGNPYPAEIDWDATGWTKTNVNNAIYTWNSSSSQYSSYVAGIGTNGGTRYIASSQAFWVQTNAASPQLIATENVKTIGNSAFLREVSPRILKLKITGGVSTFPDETIIVIDSSATFQFENSMDAIKFYTSNLLAASLASLDSVQNHYSINTMNQNVAGNEVYIRAIVGLSGSYTISFPQNTTGETNLFMEDLLTGVITNINTTPSYSFSINDTTSAPRFRLFIGKSPSGVVLPVELYSFSGQLIEETVKLTWETRSEINSDYFIVEKSTDGIYYGEIAKVQAKGNSRQESYYQSIDDNPTEGVSYYRLKQVDFDGNYVISNVISISFKPKQYTLDLQLLPNPIMGNTVYLVSNINSNYFNVVVTDVSGKIIYHKKHTLDNKLITFENQLAEGVYFITITVNNNFITKKLMVYKN